MGYLYFHSIFLHLLEGCFFVVIVGSKLSTIFSNYNKLVGGQVECAGEGEKKPESTSGEIKY